MFTVLSDLSLLERKELDIELAGSAYVSGIQGLWVTLSGGYAVPTSTAVRMAWPIWNESYRNQTVGTFTPDVTNTRKVTVLSGKYFARTSVYSGTPSEAAALDVSATGGLESGSTAPVAYVTKAEASFDYLGNTMNVIEIYVI